jgi:hypothetical protein
MIVWTETGSGYGPAVDSCEHGNEPLDTGLGLYTT